MRWTNMSEKEMIKEWAKEECLENLTREYLPMPEDDRESYWCEHSRGGDIAEYSFDTVLELKEMLEKELKEDFYRDLLLPLAVAALKERKILQIDTEAPDGRQVFYQDSEEFSIRFCVHALVSMNILAGCEMHFRVAIKYNLKNIEIF